MIWQWKLHIIHSGEIRMKLRKDAGKIDLIFYGRN
uniref:Uncharacterized protein n=1 Tax=Rhizophora mucronata TaxID=61149 RepID=A0A2P2N239_RHIMU